MKRRPPSQDRRASGARPLTAAERRRRENLRAEPPRESVRAEREPRAPGRPQGARQSQTSWRDRLEAWSAHHSTSAIESLVRLLATPLQSLMTWLVLAIALALPAALFVVFSNLQNIGYAWEDSSQISVYLKPGVDDPQAQALRLRWSQRIEVADVTYINPGQALEEFKAGSGLGSLLDQLKENPLPGVLLVKPKPDQDPTQLESLQQALAAEPMVTEVQLDLLWLKRLHQFIGIAERFVVALAILLALGVLLVIGNTIRMAIEARRDEILVMKLIGATDAYVRRPFLYTGLWYGVGGGIIASIILAIGFGWLAAPVAQLADLYQSQFRLQGLDLFESLQLVLIAGLTGLLGAWIAVARHLYQIQPR
ncbi:permease-like cell division protein FtsX [Cellvibrio japonicus]|uniref:Cell division protein FtsX n=1 Tax=Cellvibrio japonicus (strain Ueda107) TaxID=498211 RepID=B3PG44_CELJU|nr:permease-like cell division protein FtsX [Cellvibrio japonicus]ACE85861.1 cell division protein FtsX [Cellvibrio japonicus Ueda107]